MGLRGFFSTLARLSGWSTLAVGIGAASTAAAPVPQAPSRAVEDPGFARIKAENGQIHLADRNGVFRTLTLGDTPEAAELAALLSRLAPDGSPATVPVGRLIVADGGTSSSASRTDEAKRKASSGND